MFKNVDYRDTASVDWGSSKQKIFELRRFLLTPSVLSSTHTRRTEYRFSYRISSAGRRLLKFAKRGESLAETITVRLATPRCFHTGGYEPGIADDLDAAQEADMAPYVASYLSRRGNLVSERDISASTIFTAESEPWLFGTSLVPTQGVGEGSLEALKKEFEESKGVDAGNTAIDDPDQFAMRLGIEAVLSIEDGQEFRSNFGKHLFDMQLAKLICRLEVLPITNSLVWLDHGPDHYQVKELLIKTDQDMPIL